MNKTDKHQPSGFIYDARRGGVFCDACNIAPWPGRSWRRMAILDCVKSVPELSQPSGAAKYFMEIGFGTGAFAYEFFRMGFTCAGYDQSEQAVDVANQIFNRESRIIDFRNQLNENDFGKYDCLGVFEVMEHVDDDAAALKEWRRLLKPGGFLIMSVPARMKHWNYLDLRAGHVRRYEKKELVSLLTAQGFDVLHIVNWGFPFTNLTRYLRNALIHKPTYKKMQGQNQQELTQVSGVEMSREYQFKKFLPFRLIQLLGKINRLFYRFDLGDGYVVAAKAAVGEMSQR